MANYEIQGNKIIANVAALTPKQIKKIRNYMALGYTLVEREKKEPNEIWKAKTIQSWLEENATKAQINEYWEKYNAPMIDKETGEQKVTKKNKPRVKGHVATIKWFKDTFPNYPEK